MLRSPRSFCPYHRDNFRTAERGQSPFELSFELGMVCYLLLHGNRHGKWAWQHLVSLLEAQQSCVHAIYPVTVTTKRRER